MRLVFSIRRDDQTLVHFNVNEMCEEHARASRVRSFRVHLEGTLSLYRWRSMQLSDEEE